MSRGGNNPCQTKYKKNKKEKQNDFIWDLRFSCEIGASADEIVYTVLRFYTYTCSCSQRWNRVGWLQPNRCQVGLGQKIENKTIF